MPLVMSSSCAPIFAAASFGRVRLTMACAKRSSSSARTGISPAAMGSGAVDLGAAAGASAAGSPGMGIPAAKLSTA